MIEPVNFDKILDCIVDSTRSESVSRVGGPNACEVKQNSKPWIARFEGGCGGTLIAKNIVLTAKHCFSPKRPLKGAIVHLGDHSQKKFEDTQISITVKYEETLPGYSGCKDAWKRGCPDFAIAILDRDVDTTNSSSIQIANLPNPDEPCPPGKEMVACGWGSDMYNKTRSQDKLWCVAQECVDLEKCPGVRGRIPNEYALCTSDQHDGRNSPCRGDSGGPLTHTDKNGRTTLYGVVQGPGWNDKAWDCKYSESFSRVSNPDVLKWINEAIAFYA